jgi:hypothetical protein
MSWWRARGSSVAGSISMDGSVPVRGRPGVTALDLQWAMNESWPDPDRYQTMSYRRCGRSGLRLPEVSLGLWHNFGHGTALDDVRAMLRTAFDLGITHFDLANNYGPPPAPPRSSSARPCGATLRPIATSS